MIIHEGRRLPRGTHSPRPEPEAGKLDAGRRGRIGAAVTHSTGCLHLWAGALHHRDHKELPPSEPSIVFSRTSPSTGINPTEMVYFGTCGGRGYKKLPPPSPPWCTGWKAHIVLLRGVQGYDALVGVQSRYTAICAPTREVPQLTQTHNPASRRGMCRIVVTRPEIYLEDILYLVRSKPPPMFVSAPAHVTTFVASTNTRLNSERTSRYSSRRPQWAENRFPSSSTTIRCTNCRLLLFTSSGPRLISFSWKIGSYTGSGRIDCHDKGQTGHENVFPTL